jgi:cell division inhibitor SulA/protein ImuA
LESGQELTASWLVEGEQVNLCSPGVAMLPDRLQTLEGLRQRIRAIEGVGVERRRLASGVGWLDELIGGLPRPGWVDLCGQPGVGLTRLAVQLALQEARQGRSIAWIDPDRSLYPPALAAWGLPLDRLLLIHPPADGRGAAYWTAEQVLRSGCFGLVLLDAPASLPPAAGQALARAAERGAALGLRLGEGPARALPAEVRLAVEDRIYVLRDRSGGTGRSAQRPRWSEEDTPWR